MENLTINQEVILKELKGSQLVKKNKTFKAKFVSYDKSKFHGGKVAKFRSIEFGFICYIPFNPEKSAEEVHLEFVK